MGSVTEVATFVTILIAQILKIGKLDLLVEINQIRLLLSFPRDSIILCINLALRDLASNIAWTVVIFLIFIVKRMFLRLTWHIIRRVLQHVESTLHLVQSTLS